MLCSDGVLATCITGYDEEFPELQHTFGTILPQKKEGREFDKLAYMFGDLTVEKLEKQRKHWKGQSGMEDVKSTYCIVMVCEYSLIRVGEILSAVSNAVPLPHMLRPFATVQ